MKNLIRKILKEFIKNDLVVLEEVFFPNGFIKLITEGIAHYNVPSNIKTKLKNKLKTYFNWPPHTKKHYDKESWCSVDIKLRKLKDEDSEESSGVSFGCNRVIEIKLSTHWMQRLFRTLEKDYTTGGKNYNPKIKDPGLYEGIDLFFEEKNKINSFIDTANARTWNINEEKYFVLSKGSGDNVFYQLI